MILLKYLFPLAALLTLLVCARDWRSCLRDRLLWPCAAFALAGFLGCFPRPDIAHIAFAAPLACPLLACCMTRLTQRWRPAWWRYRYLVVVVAGVVIGLCVSSALYFLRISQEALRAEIVPTPRGGVAFFGQPGAPELLARIAATPSGDAYFFYPYTIHAIIPDCARAGVEIRSLYARIHAALPVSGCLYISDAACFLGRHRSALDRSQRTEAVVSCDAGR